VHTEGALIAIYQGNGPWNIEVQTVDASESKTMSFTGITSSHMTLEIPLPKRIDKDGGIFTVDLGSSADTVVGDLLLMLL
jgi:nucleoporin POM152